MALAQLTLIGHTGKDPEMSYTPAGLAVTRFSVAVTTKKGDKEETTWYNVTAFRGLAETINTHLKKGQMCFVQGDFSPRKYTDKNGGQGVSYDVIANVFQFVGGKPQSTSNAGAGLDDALEDLDAHPF